MNEEAWIIRDSIRFDSNTMAITFYYLRLNLLCNMFVIEHPELNLPFPIRRNVGMVSGYLGGDEDVIKQTKNENATMVSIKYKESLNKKFEDICIKGEDFEKIDITDKNSFKKIYDYFYILELYYDKVKKSRQCERYRPVSTGGLLSIDVTQRYFELVGYWTRIMEERAKKRNSGKGQKEAKEDRLKKLTDSISKFINDKKKEGLQITHFDKGIFLNMLSQTFIGAENYQRHPQTIATYQKEVERELGIKIVKKVPLCSRKVS